MFYNLDKYQLVIPFHLISIAILDFVFKKLFTKEANHKILVKSNNVVHDDLARGNIKIVDTDHVQEAICLALEEPLHKLLDKWSCRLGTLQSKQALRIKSEIKSIRKQMTFEESIKILSPDLPRPAFTNSIPSNIKEHLLRLLFYIFCLQKTIFLDETKTFFLLTFVVNLIFITFFYKTNSITKIGTSQNSFCYSKSEVTSFGLWENSRFKVFVKKETKIKTLRDEIEAMDTLFLRIHKLEIESKKLVGKFNMKQGDILLSSPSDNAKKSSAGTLGVFVTKPNDPESKYALTCNHLFPEETFLLMLVLLCNVNKLVGAYLQPENTTAILRLSKLIKPCLKIATSPLEERMVRKQMHTCTKEA